MVVELFVQPVSVSLFFFFFLESLFLNVDIKSTCTQKWVLLIVTSLGHLTLIFTVCAEFDTTSLLNGQSGIIVGTAVTKATSNKCHQ